MALPAASGDSRPVTSTAGSSATSPRRAAWAGRNYSSLTAAAVVTGLGADCSLIAAAFAVLDAHARRGMLADLR